MRKIVRRYDSFEYGMILSEDGEYVLHDDYAELQNERDDLLKWNHSVSVCKDHVDDIIEGDCVVCENEQLKEKIETLEEPR